jgi:hypothetical protein
MLMLFSLIYLFAINFVTGFGFAYYIFKRTLFENYFFLFAPLVGSCFTIAFISLLASTLLPLSSLMVLSLVIGALCSLVSMRSFRPIKLHIGQFWLILLFAFLAGSLAILPQILTNQYGYFHYGNDELMYYSGRAISVMSNSLPHIKIEQFDRFGTLVFLSTISFYLHQAPPLVVQIAQGVARMILIFTCFGVAQFFNTVLFKRRPLGIVPITLLGAILVLSAVEYEHFLLDFLAAQANTGIFLMLLLLILYPSILDSRKLIVFFSFLLAVLTISYPEMAFLAATLIIGSLVLLCAAYAVKHGIFDIFNWLLFGLLFGFFMIGLSGKGGIQLYFNYASGNNANYAVGGSIFGDPRADLPAFFARILGLQFLDFMPVNTLPGFVLVAFFIFYLLLWVLWYIKLTRATGYGILIIPICYLYVAFKGFNSGNFYQLAKFILYLNSFTFILWFTIKHKPRMQFLSSLFFVIILLGNASAIYRHTKYYIVQQIPKQFFSAAQIDELRKEIRERQYNGVVVNSPTYALWEFFYQNKLPVKQEVVRTQIFDQALYSFFIKPQNNLFITFPHWANRFIDTSYGDQKLGSIFIVKPEIFRNSVSPLLSNNKNILICNKGSKAEQAIEISTGKLHGKLLFAITSISAKQPNQARLEIKNLATNEIRKSGLYKKASTPQRLGISYRVPDNTSAVSLIYVVEGSQPGCAVFADTDVLVISAL